MTDISTSSSQVSAASFTPLWADACSAAQAEAAVASLRRSGLLQPGGVATTLVASGQQWDWPNAWPPLQQMLVEGLAGCGAAGGAVLAEEVALCWLRSNHRGWLRDGVMREKYDATRPGESGGGGEYAPQVSRRMYFRRHDPVGHCIWASSALTCTQCPLRI